jgi:MFS family permease
VIVGVLALVQVVGVSINFAGGVLVQPLADAEGEFGFSLREIGASYGLYYLAAAVLAPFAGWMGDRYGARRLMVLGAVVYGSVLVLGAFISQPWHLLLTFGAMRGAVQAIFMVPLMAVVSVWFRRRLGMGTGVLWAASGLGPAMMSPLLGYLIPGIGWELTFLILGGVAGGLMPSDLLGCIRVGSRLLRAWRKLDL